MGKKSEQEIKAVIIKLVKYRHDNNIRQTTMAAKFGLTRSEYSKIESYKRVPTIGFLRKAAQIVGKTMEELCES